MTEATSDPRFVVFEFEPVAAPDVPGHEFAFAYLPTFGPATDGPHLFVPPGYPDPDERLLRRLSSICDHTGREERKTSLFVLRRLETGGWVQVSLGALADYLGDPMAASRLSAWATYLNNLEVTIREAQPREGRTHFDVQEVIAEALASIELHGWVSRGQAHRTGDRATASDVLDVLETDGSSRVTTTDVIDKAREIVQWLREVRRAEYASGEHPTDYLHNLAAVASLEYVEARHVGLLCSAPGAYADHLVVERMKASRPEVNPGAHYGVLDTRAEADVFVDAIENRGENEWGVSLLVHMHVVPTGERLKWWTGEGLKLDEGKQYHVRMGIKKHGEWDGVKETTVSRVSEYDPPAKPEKKPRVKKT